jgi:hypothetical protein
MAWSQLTGTPDSSRNPAFIFSDAGLHAQFRFECKRSSASCPVCFELPLALDQSRMVLIWVRDIPTQSTRKTELDAP